MKEFIEMMDDRRSVVCTEVGAELNMADVTVLTFLITTQSIVVVAVEITAFF